MSTWQRDSRVIVSGRRGKGSYDSFMNQMKLAEEVYQRCWATMLKQGYVEVAPGVLRHPETSSEVRGG